MSRFRARGIFVRDERYGHTLYPQDAVSLLKKMVGCASLSQLDREEAQALCRALHSAIGNTVIEKQPA